MMKLTIEQFVGIMDSPRAKGMSEGEPFEIDLEAESLYLGSQYIPLESRPANYGGKQWYFVCPDCDTKRRVLYGEIGLMACGECQGIYKQTRNRTKTDCGYWWDMALKEIRKLDPNFKPPKGYVDYDDFPKRPKWMRWPDYLKRWRKFHKYMDKAHTLWLKGW
ncbi:hypothetical protein E5983_00485 [Streptococcus danieliae]|uniref:Phage protein n=1 Tax=Streptococcus danieliae TaxID=747656 RepID=A0A7X3KBR6_9STRE|nr:hypothetical protein [Streptococcus danieliae]MVX58152.1 hypothetical protein [Streptococcus danieliae]